MPLLVSNQIQAPIWKGSLHDPRLCEKVNFYQNGNMIHSGARSERATT